MKISKLIKDKKLAHKIFPYNVHDYQTINPKNNKFIKKYDTISHTKTTEILNKSQLSFENYRYTTLEDRFAKFKKLGDNLELNINKISEIISLEMGKPITQGIGEVRKCIGHINYYIKNTEQYVKNKNVDYEGFNNEIHYMPMGPILSINPWNFPFWVPFKSIIPSMFVGK